MEDFMKKVPTMKHVREMEPHHKTVYSHMQHSKAPYSSSEMSKAMNCYQSQGNGLGGNHKQKMPSYGNYGEVLSVTHGHKDVGPKI